ncbi:MAG: hypothetical protein KY463_12635, partial [Actinobacteria bacterium]|nr:hypothetical protein [Actinomycetota bacterium]
GQPPPVLGDDAKLALRAYDWPGNVRELRNAIERAVVVQSTGTITADDLPDRVREAGHRARPALADGPLKEQLRDGTSIADIAKANGKSLTDVRSAVRAAVKTRLEQAVKAGDLTEKQADAILGRVEARVAMLGSGKRLRLR